MFRTRNISSGHRAGGLAAAAMAALALALGTTTSAANPATADTNAPSTKPTVVLVHGAWADASSFAPVTKELQEDGYTVLVRCSRLPEAPW